MFSFASLTAQEVIAACYAQSYQMNDTRRSDTSIVKFVREHLGCTCPDEVFDNVSVIEQSSIFSSANTVYEIGGRLFVAVFVSEDWRDMAGHLGKLVDAGKQYRDLHGYNRFRLVIATSGDDATKNLQFVFDDLSNTDDKTHLHVITPDLLP